MDHEAPSPILLRGRLLSFNARPDSLGDASSYTYEEDGGLLIRDGKIAVCGHYSEVKKKIENCNVQIIDHRPHLILPGFIDTHLHFPQTQVIGSWADQLLDWLNDYTFPEEMKFADKAHADRLAKSFFDILLSHGTTTASAYCSSHPASVDAYFEEAQRRGMLMLGGKAMMDRNAPEALCDTAQTSYDDSKKLLEKWHDHSRCHYVISPRFAITSTPAQLEAAGTLLSEHPDCHLQTHLNENHEEIAFTKSLYPNSRNYLEVYGSYGLLGEKSLLGHCIHMTNDELSLMRETSSVAVFCPTSNLFLGSGLFNKEKLEAQGIRTSIATDIGGGTSYSMLRTLDEGYKILQLQRQRLHPLECFYWITLGNAQALFLSHKIGTLEEGTDADLVVLNSTATPAMALRMETADTLSEELFILQTMGDDRAVQQTYVYGAAT